MQGTYFLKNSLAHIASMNAQTTQGSHVDRVLLLQEETGEQGERGIVGGVRRCQSRCAGGDQ